jgi:hypothetical protein
MHQPSDLSGRRRTRPTFYLPYPLLHVFLETVCVVIPPGFAGPEVDVVVVAQVVSEVAEPVVDVAVVVVAQVVSEVVEPVVDVAAVVVVEPEVDVAAVVVVEPEVVFVVDPDVSESGIVFVAVVSVADVAEPQASVDIAPVFVVLVPVSVFAVEVDSSGRPRFLSFPKIDYSASSSSSVEAVR